VVEGRLAARNMPAMLASADIASALVNTPARSSSNFRVSFPSGFPWDRPTTYPEQSIRCIALLCTIPSLLGRANLLTLDRPLVHINRKGWPVSRCPLYRGLRKARTQHVKCGCAERRMPNSWAWIFSDENCFCCSCKLLIRRQILTPYSSRNL
jgi:hypothetical protein